MATTTLRAVTHRLTTTPVSELPAIASFLASSLSDCSELLLAAQNQKPAKGDSDHATQIHKLKTRLASLLQDRTVEGRWAAVVLVKATVEAGQWEILRGCEPIVRNLISILGKPDPVSTRKMSVITLTRIFHLTYQYPTLVREITTPSLPSFITAALNLVSVKPSSETSRKLKPNTPFLETVFHALLELIGRHPTIFRPFSAQIHSLLVAILGSSPGTFAESVLLLAEKLFVSLHHCAPKNTGSDEWKTAMKMAILSIHRTSDFVFRAVVEQWDSSDPALRQSSVSQDYSQEVGDDESDPLGLPAWRGLHYGAERLVTLIQLLSGFVTTQTASTVQFPLGQILDVTSRLTSVLVPRDGAESSGCQANPQIGRDERDALWIELPRIHTACLQLFETLIQTFEIGVVPVVQTMLEQTLWTFRAEKFNKEVRRSLYDTVHAALPLVGSSMSKRSVSNLTAIIRSCCQDVLPTDGDSSAFASSATEIKPKLKSSSGTTNADSFLSLETKKGHLLKTSSPCSELHDAASQLLAAVLGYIPTERLAPSLRAEIDRTLILASDKNAMLASVLNPVPISKGRGAAPSIIPFLVRAYSTDMHVEALIRPRMPVLMHAPDLTGLSNGDLQDEDEDEEKEEEGVQEENHIGPQASLGATSIVPEFPLVSGAVTAAGSLSGPPGLAASPNKRPLAEDSTAISVTSPTHPALSVRSQETTTTKKARFDVDMPMLGLPTTSAEIRTHLSSSGATAASASEDRATAAPDISAHNFTSTANNPKSADSGRSLASSAFDAAEDDSDDELPTLNIEPDTDEDEEDEEDEDEDNDVAMKG